MRVIIAGGGTGGHLFPGIAVAREIQRRYPGSDILFVGSEYGIEKKIVPQEGFPLKTLSVGGIKGIGWARRIRNVVAVVIAMASAHAILKDFRPDVVIGVGGYASFPVVAAAVIAGLPRVIMEQNVVPGLANRMLGRWVDFAAISDSRTSSYFGPKAVVTGNPVRPEFKSIPAKDHVAPYTVLIFGGSQGAQTINRATVDALAHLSSWKDRLRFVHQTGELQVEEIRKAYAAAGFNAEVQAFFHEFHRRYAAADLIISRAGATTVAEIRAAGRCAILIPFPFATDDHQRQNARAMAEEGAAVMIENAELSGKRLSEAMLELLSNPDRLKQMEANARRIARLDAEAQIVNLIEAAIEKRNK